MVQICSNSMAFGINFYRNREKELFKNSVETEHFTLLFNYLFDALNHKYPADIICDGSNDFEVLNLKQHFTCCITCSCSSIFIMHVSFLEHYLYYIFLYFILEKKF